MWQVTLRPSGKGGPCSAVPSARRASGLHPPPPETLHLCLCLCSLFGGSDYKLIYRHYATLYFVFCVDSSESELGILDLIQVGLSAVRFTARERLAGTSPHSTVLAGQTGPTPFRCTACLWHLCAGPSGSD